MSQWLLPSVTVALELKLFDLIGDHPGGLTLSEITELLVVSERGMKALLQSLVAQRYLETSMDSSLPRYQCTHLSRTFLVKSNPQFFWGDMLSGGDSATERHLQLLDAVKNDGIIGAAEEWESGDLTVERAKELTSAFHSHSLPAALGAARKFPLGSTKNMLDIGGGSGCYSAAFVEANDHLHATVMDLPQVCQVAKRYFYATATTVQQRLHTLPADFFRDEWPTPADGYDAIFFSNILHDWSMVTCKELLKQSFGTLPEGGKLLIHEIFLDSDEVTPACFSIHMAVYTRGQQFFFHELKHMIEGEGFVDVTSSATHGYYSIVSATKPVAN